MTTPIWIKNIKSMRKFEMQAQEAKNKFRIINKYNSKER